MVNNRLVRLCHEWFARALFEIHGEPPLEIGGLLLGAPLWGDEFVARFERWCMSSLVAPENAAALKGSRIVLFTDDDSVGRIASSKRRLEGAGIPVLLRRIPSRVMAFAEKDGNARYMILGTVNNISVQMAARWGMGFHMMQPDMLYCADFFAKLMRLAQQHHAIVYPGLMADLPRAEADLERFRRPDGHPVAPASELNAVAWSHLHPHFATRLMTDAHDIEERLPWSVLLGWRAADRLVIMSPHQHPMYLSSALCRYAPSRVPHTMDGELPPFLPFGFYSPRVEDGLVVIELSGPDKGHDARILTATQWVNNLWEVIKFRDNYLPILATRVELELPRTTECLTVEEIEHQRMALLERVQATKLSALEAWSQRMIDD